MVLHHLTMISLQLNVISLNLVEVVSKTYRIAQCSMLNAYHVILYVGCIVCIAFIHCAPFIHSFPSSRIPNSWLYYAENFHLLTCFAIEFTLSEFKIVKHYCGIQVFSFQVYACTAYRILCHFWWHVGSFLWAFTLQISLNVSH